MNLAEAYLLTNDLAILKGQTLTDFYCGEKYVNHNAFIPSCIFPVISFSGINIAPRLETVGRWGRHIILQFTTCTIVFKMSYRTNIVVSSGTYPEDTTHSDIGCLLTLGTRTSMMWLMYLDPMNCGGFSVYPAGVTPAEFGHLGLDIMDSSFTPQYLMSEAVKLTHVDKQVCLKSFIMSNRVIAWLDNELASEVLFLSGLNPRLDVEACLTFNNAMILVKSIKILYDRVLSCLRNDFCLTVPIPVSTLYSIYNREGDACVICESTIQRTIIDGRSTFWCPTCQMIRTKEMPCLS